MVGDLAGASLDIARGYASGATMWCVAPKWPCHARHVAAAFVRPVIVGQPALAAVAIVGSDLVDRLRAVARPGDILVAISTAAEASTCAVMRRAPLWGLTSIWVGRGSRPAPGSADRVIWVDDELTRSAYDDRLVLVYHLLSELTHVWLAYGGMLGQDAGAPSEPGDGGRCITCSDEGRLAEVVDTGPLLCARVRTAGGLESIDTTLIGTPSGPRPPRPARGNGPRHQRVRSHRAA
ncbi:MAG: hydrogenase assembly protein HupF [Acidimicrobiales bacterium]